MEKKFAILIMVLICCCAVVFVQAEESSVTPSSPSLEAQVFSWKGYEMCFPFKSMDMAAFGLNMEGGMLLVRLAPTEGTIAFKDFNQTLFCVQDAAGTRQPVKFFIIPNTKKLGTIDGLPADQQEYIDLLFVLEDDEEAAPEELAMVALEESEGEPVFRIALGDIPDFAGEE